MAAHGQTEAAVLVAMFGYPERPGHRLHRAPPRSAPPRRRDLVSRRPPVTRPMRTCSRPRCARPRRRSACDAADVEVVGALPPIGTFVTSYKVHPFVGLIADGLQFEPSPHEVETVLAFTARAAARGLRDAPPGPPRRPDPHPHLPGREHLIWGATARILGELLERLAADRAISRSRAAAAWRRPRSSPRRIPSTAGRESGSRR